MTLDLRAVARTLSLKPGVYLFTDARGAVLYVGKANSLRKRVLQYGDPTRLDPAKQELVQRARGIDTIVTATDAEALALEATLIEKHAPPYNVRLMDDSSYLYVKITNEPYPTISLTRRVLPDGAWYRGPFPSARAIRQTLKEARKLFPWCAYGGPGPWAMGHGERRTERERTNAQAPTPMPQQACFAYHLGLCPGICIRAISLEEYQQSIARLKRFLDGDTKDALRALRARMDHLSKTQAYEQAARVRDAIQSIERTMTPQNVVTPRRESADVIGIARRGTHAAAAVVQVREGRVLGEQVFSLLHPPDEPTAAVLRGFLLQYYTRAPGEVPEIILPEDIEDQEELAAWLESGRGARMRVTTAQRGWKRRLRDLAAANAEEALKKSLTELTSPARLGEALKDLADTLRLSAPPKRIEAYDISNIQGTLATGSMIVFTEGKPSPPEYRKFQIVVQGTPNDVAMMKEVLRRRFGRHARAAAMGQGARGMGHGTSGGHGAWAMGQGKRRTERDRTNTQAPTPKPQEWPLPDLVLLDGGKGQLNAGIAVLRELHLDIPIAALAKREEELYVPAGMGHGAGGRGRPRTMAEGRRPITEVRLPRTSPALYLIQRLRDEAHRFTLGYHRLLRKKRMTRSLLEEIPGVGDATRKKLLRAFGSIAAIQRASREELARVLGSQKQVETIQAFLAATRR